MLGPLIDEGILTRKLAEDSNVEYVTIANEELIEAWPTLRGWIDEQADLIKLRSLLEDQANRWELSGRHWSLLLPPASIESALTLIADPRGVTPRTVAFVKESEQRIGVEKKAEESQSAAEERRLLDEAAYRRKVRLASYAAAGLVATVLLGWLFQSYIRPAMESYLVLRSVRTKINPKDGLKYVSDSSGQVSDGLLLRRRLRGGFFILLLR